MAREKLPPEEQKRRIFRAANELFEENGRSAEPTVEEVRERAAIGIKFACKYLREWSKEKEVAPSAVAEELPQELRAVMDDSLRAFWRVSQRLAKEAFDIERAKLEEQRAEADADCEHVSTAFDRAAEELNVERRRATTLESEVVQRDAQIAELRDSLASQSEQLAVARAKVESGESQNALLRELLAVEQKGSSDLEAELIEHVRAARSKAGAKKARRPAEQPEAPSAVTSVTGKLFGDGPGTSF